MSVRVHIPSSEIKQLEKEIKSLTKKFEPRVTQRVFSKAAKPYIHKVREEAPRAKRVVKRYNTPKSFSNKRAPKGQGVVAAEYHPGNLGRSFKRLRFRRSYLMRAIFIGPKRARTTTGVFRTIGKSDGWYAHLVDDIGYIKNEWNATRDTVVKNIANEFRLMLRTR